MVRQLRLIEKVELHTRTTGSDSDERPFTGGFKEGRIRRTASQNEFVDQLRVGLTGDSAFCSDISKVGRE